MRTAKAAVSPLRWRIVREAATAIPSTPWPITSEVVHDCNHRACRHSIARVSVVCQPAAGVQAQIWQLRFHAAPAILKAVHHDLATTEDVLRYQVTRSRDKPKIKQWRVAHHYSRLADFDSIEAGTQQQASAAAAPPEHQSASSA